MRVLRTVVAVAIGFGVFVVGSAMVWSAQTEQAGPAFVAGSYGNAAGLAPFGGPTAPLLGGGPYFHLRAGVAGLIVVGAVVDAVLGLHPGVRWYDLAAALLMAPAALLGGWARQRMAGSEA